MRCILGLWVKICQLTALYWINSKQLENWDTHFSSCEILDENDNEKENIRILQILSWSILEIFLNLHDYSNEYPKMPGQIKVNSVKKSIPNLNNKICFTSRNFEKILEFWCKINKYNENHGQWKRYKQHIANVSITRVMIISALQMQWSYCRFLFISRDVHFKAI